VEWPLGKVSPLYHFRMPVNLTALWQLLTGLKKAALRFRKNYKKAVLLRVVVVIYLYDKNHHLQKISEV